MNHLQYLINLISYGKALNSFLVKVEELVVKYDLKNQAQSVFTNIINSEQNNLRNTPQVKNDQIYNDYTAYLNNIIQAQKQFTSMLDMYKQVATGIKY